MSKPIKISDDYLNAFKFGFKFLILVSALSIPLIIGTTVGGLTFLIFQKIPVLYVSKLEVLRLQTSPFSKEDLTQYNGSVEQIKTEFDILTARPLSEIPDDELKRIAGVLQNQPKEVLYVLLNRKVNDKSEKNELEREITNILADSETRTITYLDNLTEKVYLISNGRKIIIYDDFTLAGIWIFGIILFFIVIVCLALYFPIFKAFSNLFKFRKIIK